jgi:iron-sulfur cluster assembly protein
METTTITSTPVSLTDSAVRALKEIILEQSIPQGLGLRVGVKGGGCSGLSYIMGFDAAKENDEEFEIDGIKVLLNRAHGMYVAGMEIDYYDGLENRGFIFNNPSAKSTCGCGSSFHA